MTQEPPPVPQVAALGATQTPLAQQPLGQDWALHTQAPATQVVPAPQAGPLPQVHTPAAGSQLSLVAVLHAMHAPPEMPQVAAAGA